MRTRSAKPLKVLVVDDEALARRRLVDLLNKTAGVAEVLEAGDGPAAVQAIAGQRPDLVFLDMQMPGPSGLDVVDAVGRCDAPAVAAGVGELWHPERSRADAASTAATATRAGRLGSGARRSRRRGRHERMRGCFRRRWGRVRRG